MPHSDVATTQHNLVAVSDRLTSSRRSKIDKSFDADASLEHFIASFYLSLGETINTLCPGCLHQMKEITLGVVMK